jgi:hypothetical protein
MEPRSSRSVWTIYLGGQTAPAERLEHTHLPNTTALFPTQLAARTQTKKKRAALRQAPTVGTVPKPPENRIPRICPPVLLHNPPFHPRTISLPTTLLTPTYPAGPPPLAGPAPPLSVPAPNPPQLSRSRSISDDACTCTCMHDRHRSRFGRGAPQGALRARGCPGGGGGKGEGKRNLVGCRGTLAGGTVAEVCAKLCLGRCACEEGDGFGVVFTAGLRGQGGLEAGF